MSNSDVDERWRYSMIREQSSGEPLFYISEEIARPAASNFYGRLNGVVGDWRKLAEPFEKAFCRGVGRPTDPVVYLKIFLVAYIENIIYDTDLAERISDSIAIREFLGYSLTHRTPDHSSISRNRDRIAQHCRIEEVLGHVVALCQKGGLVDASVTAVDSSLIPANASLSSLRSVRTGKNVEEHLREVAEHNRDAEKTDGVKKKVAVSNEEFCSQTDPDARIAKKAGQKRDMCYKVTHLTDGGSGVVLAAGVSRADKGEVEAAMPVVEEAQANLERCGKSLATVTADAGYGSTEFHAYLEGLGAAPVTHWRPDTIKKPDGFRKESFIYDKEADCYICPAGSRLRYRSFSSSTGLFHYQSDAAVCMHCEHKNSCIDGKGCVRTVSRHPKEEVRERSIARSQTDEGRRALSRRKGIVEGPFGHMKTYGGLGLMSCRGKGKAHVKAVMGAVAYNLTKLVKAVGDGSQGAMARNGLTKHLNNAIWTLKKLFGPICRPQASF